MSVSLDNSAMQQLQAEQRALLDTIDELRALGLGEHIHLPQLIVVGDQSVGKSSVLEAISRIRFPIKDGVCTRFATQLALRRSPQTKIEVKDQNDRLGGFNRSGFDKDDLPRIIEEAKQHMGFTEDSTGFSEDVLCIEIAGPDLPQLTLIDLPGFFHNETENQNAAGIAVVDRLAEKYMSQDSSIILAVISAQNGLAAQQVLRVAKKHDPGCDRILGIITKPDKVDAESDNEQTYLRLALNEETAHKLKLGWHVLRNRAQKETDSTDAERDEKEKSFFQSGVWSAISPEDRGIEMLREKLSQVLLGHIQRKLPGLIANIEENIKTREMRLKSLGDQRATPGDMKKYLFNISSRFQRVARDAIHGIYADEFFGGLYPDMGTAYEDRRVKKLRALVRDLNRAFHLILTTKGGRRQIKWNDEGTVPNENSPVPHHLEPLVGLYTVGEHIEVSIDDLIRELDGAASENQGIEFPGSSNDRVALALFRDHSAPWEAIAHQHVDLVGRFARIFVEKLVAHVAGPDSNTADAVIKGIVTPFFEEKQAVLHSKVLELLHHYKTGSDPQPMYSIFLEGMERRRNKRVAKHVGQLLQENAGLLTDSVGDLGQKAVALKLLESSSKVSNEFNAEQIIDNAMEYYDMSLRVFTDNVITLALENCLISDIPNILSPEKVYDMSDDKVTELAAESKQIREERKKLQLQLEKLRMGFAACREYRPRESSTVFPKSPLSNVTGPQSTILGSASQPETSANLKPPSSIRSGLTPSSTGSRSPTPSPNENQTTMSLPVRTSQGNETTPSKPGLVSNLVAGPPPRPEASKQKASGSGLFATTAPSNSSSKTGNSSTGLSAFGTSNPGNTSGFYYSRDSPSTGFGSGVPLGAQLTGTGSFGPPPGPASGSGGHSLFGGQRFGTTAGSLLPSGENSGAPAGTSSPFGGGRSTTSTGTPSLFAGGTTTATTGTPSLFSGQRTQTTAGAPSLFGSGATGSGSNNGTR